MGTTIYLDRPQRQPAAAPQATGPDPVKLLLIWPWLGMGGAERWIIAMASLIPHISKELGGRPIVVSAVVVQYDLDQDIHRELAQFAPVVTNRLMHESSPQIDSLVAGADLIIIGGLTDMRRLVRFARCPVIFIAHGACALTATIAGNAHDDRTATHFTAVSEISKSICPDRVRDRFTVIENGAEVERTTTLRGRDAIREQWGIQPGQKVVGYVGRFGPDKRSEALGEAIAHLPAEYVGVLVGNGQQEQAAVRHCQDLAPGRIIFGGRFRQVGDALAGLDAWLNASPAEGFCLSRIEASLAGVPVISTPTGDLARLEAQHGQLVWTIPIDAPGPEIAAVIERCFTDQQTTGEIVERSRRLSFARYTSATMVARWVSYLRSLLGVPS